MHEKWLWKFSDMTRRLRDRSDIKYTELPSATSSSDESSPPSPSTRTHKKVDIDDERLKNHINNEFLESNGTYAIIDSSIWYYRTGRRHFNGPLNGPWGPVCSFCALNSFSGIVRGEFFSTWNEFFSREEFLNFRTFRGNKAKDWDIFEKCELPEIIYFRLNLVLESSNACFFRS